MHIFLFTNTHTHADILIVFVNYDEVFGIFECFSVAASSVILILILLLAICCKEAKFLRWQRH